MTETITQDTSVLEARLAIVTAASMLRIQPDSLHPDDIAKWAEKVANHPDLMATIDALEPLNGVVKALAMKKNAKVLYGRLKSVNFNERNQRHRYEFQKIDGKTGEVVTHPKYGDKDGGNGLRVDGNDQHLAAMAAEAAKAAKPLVGEIVRFRKFQETRGGENYATIVSIEPYTPLALRAAS